MKKCLVFALIAGIGVLGMLAAVPAADAQAIGIKFAADQPTSVSSTPPSGVQWPGPGSVLAPTDITPSAANGGVYPQGNWNNVTTNLGVQMNLVEDGTPLGTGVAVHTTAQVLWYASNTWSSTGLGEENNNFKGPQSANYPGYGADAVLMAGYLDMETQNPEVTFIQITNIPPEIASGFGVFLYAVPGVPGRGGVYAVDEQNNSSGTGTYQYYVASGTQDPTKAGTQGLFSGPDFSQAVGDDMTYGANGSQDDFGNFLYWTGLSGTTVTITAISQPMPALTGYNGTVRAPIAAIQLVAGG
jgi:hypothetical protein